MNEFVDYTYLRNGPWYDTCDVLRRVLGAIGRRDRWWHVKIGYTANPETRAYEYQRFGWQRLFPIYSTSSVKFAQDMEQALISYSLNESLAGFQCHNRWGGRNGRVAISARRYFVYVAAAKKFTRFRDVVVND